MRRSSAGTPEHPMRTAGRSPPGLPSLRRDRRHPGLGAVSPARRGPRPPAESSPRSSRPANTARSTAMSSSRPCLEADGELEVAALKPAPRRPPRPAGAAMIQGRWAGHGSSRRCLVNLRAWLPRSPSPSSASIPGTRRPAPRSAWPRPGARRGWTRSSD
jgi:hypothetical protein